MQQETGPHDLRVSELLVHTAMFIADTQICFNYLVRKILKLHPLDTKQ
jgi:hypothetical protein